MDRSQLFLTPYKGLTPYQEQDAPYFFGRSRDIRIVVSNLIASRLTLLYGASGVGKSSLINAGVLHHFGERAEEDIKTRSTPKFVAVNVRSWRDAPLVELQEEIKHAIENAPGELTSTLPEPTGSLSQTLQSWTESLDIGLLIILDQFEDYFLYHGHESGKVTFLHEFPRVVTNPTLNVNFLISMRDDSLAKLALFKTRIPNLFSNYLEIKHLGYDAAIEAIEKPIEQFHNFHPEDDTPDRIEPALVKAVLDQVKTGQVQLGNSGPRFAKGESGEYQVETPFLQLVMARLWFEEFAVGSRTLRLATLNNLGGAKTIVQTHLESVMQDLPINERQVLMQLFPKLVTPRGNALILSLSDLAEYAGPRWPEYRLKGLLNRASSHDMRILRPLPPAPSQPDVPRYQIFHDVLASVIIDYVEIEQEKANKLERRRRRQFQRATVGLAIVFLAAVVAIIYAAIQNAEVEADRELLNVKQHRIQTLASGGVILDDVPGSQQSDTFYATLTAVAVLNEWAPVEDEVDGFPMVSVPPGCFIMGSIFAMNEQPPHEICFDQVFWIDQFEVSNRDFWPIDDSGQQFDDPGRQAPPVDAPRVQVTWEEARDFCKERGARLPTEAEWEYAARGPDSFMYPWGNEFVGDFVASSIVLLNPRAQLEPVTSLREGASWVGAYNMSGNAWEWVSSLDMAYPYDADDGRENSDAAAGKRGYRGGGYLSFDQSELRSTFRRSIGTQSAFDEVGLRCARDDL